MRMTHLVAVACLVCAAGAAFADGSDKGWDALEEIFSKPGKTIDRDHCDIAVTLNYDKYIQRMADIRDAWLYRDNSVEYYQRRSYQVLVLISLKEATMLTQAFFGPQARGNIQFCRFRLFSTDRDKYGNDEPLLMASWSFNSKVASKINWDKVEDKNFPQLAADYKFGQEFERRMRQDPPP